MEPSESSYPFGGRTPLLPPVSAFSTYSLLRNCNYFLGTPSQGSRLALSPSSAASNLKKQRSEKKPIPEEQKDDKYFERRRRNNQAAKKSRDARKVREDQVALRATILEHENAILRAQVLTLREEASSLRQMLLQRKTYELPPVETQLCVRTQ